MKPWIYEKLSQGGHTCTHALWIYSLGHILVKIDIFPCENRYFSVPRLFMHAVKSFQSEFLQRIPVTCTDNEKINKYIDIYIFYIVVFLWGLWGLKTFLGH